MPALYARCLAICRYSIGIASLSMCRVRFSLAGIHFDELKPNRLREEHHQPLIATLPLTIEKEEVAISNVINRERPKVNSLNFTPPIANDGVPPQRWSTSRRRNRKHPGAKGSSSSSSSSSDEGHHHSIQHTKRKQGTTGSQGVRVPSIPSCIDDDPMHQ